MTVSVLWSLAQARGSATHLSPQPGPPLLPIPAVQKALVPALHSQMRLPSACCGQEYFSGPADYGTVGSGVGCGGGVQLTQLLWLWGWMCLGRVWLGLVSLPALLLTLASISAGQTVSMVSRGFPLSQLWVGSRV